jgi:nucleotide-binding universal stress UspA family protein
MNQSIVCGIDNSQVSDSAARVAARLARELDLKLVLVHVADDPPTFPYKDSRLRELQRRDAIREATALLERVAATLSGAEPETRALLGDPAEALTTVGREEAELVVVGSRGRGPLAAAMLGSVSTRVASAADCLVMVVPSPEAADRFLARTPGGRLICGVDDSGASIRALRLAAGLAERIELDPLLLHVEADGGDPVEALRERALEADASAIVVGSRGRGTWRAAALGSVSGALAATAPVPVLVMPQSARLTHLARNVREATVADALDGARHWATHRTPQALANGRTPREAAVEHERTGRFSQGLEQLPQTPSKLRQGRFSDGIEALPATPDKLQRGRFSEGIEQLPETAATVRRGSFADGYHDIPAPASQAA